MLGTNPGAGLHHLTDSLPRYTLPTMHESSNLAEPKQRYWIRFSICCVWLACAVAAHMVPLDSLNVQINVRGAIRLVAVIIETTSPLAMIWLLILLKESWTETTEKPSA